MCDCIQGSRKSYTQASEDCDPVCSLELPNPISLFSFSCLGSFESLVSPRSLLLTSLYELKCSITQFARQGIGGEGTRQNKTKGISNTQKKSKQWFLVRIFSDILKSLCPSLFLLWSRMSMLSCWSYHDHEHGDSRFPAPVPQSLNGDGTWPCGASQNGGRCQRSPCNCC